jgi:hypothetical protein
MRNAKRDTTVMTAETIVGEAYSLLQMPPADPDKAAPLLVLRTRATIAATILADAG